MFFNLFLLYSYMSLDRKLDPKENKILMDHCIQIEFNEDTSLTINDDVRYMLSLKIEEERGEKLDLKLLVRDITDVFRSSNCRVCKYYEEMGGARYCRNQDKFYYFGIKN